VKRTFTSHRQWVTSVKWHPSSSNIFASCSRDGTAKLWDIRSKVALYTLLPPESSASSTEKKGLIPLLTVCWKGQDTLLSGGCNKTVRSHLVKVPSDLPVKTTSTPTPFSSSSPSSTTTTTTTATTEQTQTTAKKPANKKQT
jgi:WD40 repeat protein